MVSACDKTFALAAAAIFTLAVKRAGKSRKVSKHKTVVLAAEWISFDLLIGSVYTGKHTSEVAQGLKQPAWEPQTRCSSHHSRNTLDDGHSSKPLLACCIHGTLHKAPGAAYCPCSWSLNAV